MDRMSLNKLKHSSYFTEHVRWDVTPKLFAPQITAADGSQVAVDTTYGYMLYVDLINEKPAIIVMQLRELISKTVGFIDEAPEEMLREAMKCPASECISGMYPLTEELKSWLKTKLGLS